MPENTVKLVPDEGQAQSWAPTILAVINIITLAAIVLARIFGAQAQVEAFDELKADVYKMRTTINRVDARLLKLSRHLKAEEK